MTALSDNSSDLDKRRASQSQPYKVTWDDPDDPENPRNWANRRRWTVTLVVSLFTFISPVASSISSPSLPQISTRFQIPAGSILEDMSLSIFVLAYAIGPLFWGPLSELYGRLIILQSSNMFFLLFNTVCAFANNSTQLLVFRFLAGLGGAAPQSVGGAVVGDLWAPEERGSAMALYSLAPLVGPATGPLVGGWIAEKSRWQWVFWSVSIADAILQIVAFFTVRETYGPIILSRRAKHLSNLRQDVEKSPSLGVVAPPRQSLGDVMLRGMVRPFIFLATEPIVQVFALYMAILYGLLYLTLVHYVNVYTNQYSQSEGIAGLHYLSIALGSTVGGQIGARTLNYLYRYLKAKNNGVGTPEMRLPLLMVTATTLPIGLLIYGWAVQAHTHWIIPDIGVFIFSIGIGGNWTCIQTYLVDSYAIYAASAIAGVTSFRAFAGFGFPLFQDKLYGSLGDGWGNSLLALICLVIGCPAPFIFYKYGPVLRAKGKGDAQGL